MKYRNFPPPVVLIRKNDVAHASLDEELLSRRLFLKSTGGATLATLIAWSASAIDAKAQGTSPSGSGSSTCYKVTSDPDNSTSTFFSAIEIPGPTSQVQFKIKFIVTPPNGAHPSKDLAAQVECWATSDYEASVKFTSSCSVWGQINHHSPHGSSCIYSGGVNDTTPTAGSIVQVMNPQFGHGMFCDRDWKNASDQRIEAWRMYSIVFKVWAKGSNSTESWADIEAYAIADETEINTVTLDQTAPKRVLDTNSVTGSGGHCITTTIKTYRV